MKNALIFTEYGAQIGLGHLRRCEALKEKLAEAGFSVEIRANTDPRSCDLAGVDLGVIDSYLLPLESYEWLARRAKVALFFDDTLRLDYPSGIVLNGAIGAENLPYTPKKGRILWLGARYILIANTFCSPLSRAIPALPKRLLITLGGSKKAQELQESLTQAICAHYKELEILQIDPTLDAQGISEVMRRADMALSASGGTLNELAACAVPTIALLLAENQRTLRLGYLEKEAVISADSSDYASIFSALELLHSPNERARLSKNMQKIIKEVSWKRHCEMILELLS